jgi:flagellar basal-body rod protein FlgG
MRALYTAATGMRAFQTKIDNIANNLANSNTTGYKKVRETFEDLMYQRVGSAGGSAGTTASDPMQVGSGVRLAALQRDMGRGDVTMTSNPYDVVIDGDGFFVVETANGDERYTRDGHFHVDGEGNLVTTDNYRISPGISIPSNSDITIGGDGTVTAMDLSTGETTNLGTLEVARFANPGGLSALGGNLFAPSAASGEAQRTTPGEDGTGQLVQYALEGSNVDVAEELVSMITAQRSYELSSKVIQAADEMMQTANQLKR